MFHTYAIGVTACALAACGGGGDTGKGNIVAATGGAGNGSNSGGSSSAGGNSSGGSSNSTGGSGNGTGGSASGSGGSGNGTGGKATGGANPTGGASSAGGAATGGRTSTNSGGAFTGGRTSTSTGGTTSGTGGTSGGSNGGALTGGRTSVETGGTNQGGSSVNTGGKSSTGGTSSTTSTSTSTGSATIVPDASWACGMATGIPAPTLGKLVFHATLQLGGIHDVGATQYGHRRIIDVKSGSGTGDKLNATFQSGGLDLELTLSNGSIELEEINILKASDGTPILLRTCGVAPAGDSTVRIVPDFEVATSSSLAWLNTGKFAGTRVLDAAGTSITLDIYDISSVTAGDPRIQLTDPSGVPNQPWECSTTTGTKGSSVFTESVTLGNSISIGTSKRGSRNIIPITGGTVTGSKLNGKVLNGGADYQLTASGSSTKLDARYSLSSTDGEFVLVRNCGAFGALIPQFEARAAGPYAFLNTNAYLSSDPGSVSSGVSITFYERK